MSQSEVSFDSRSSIEQILGYLNFSSGSCDLQLLLNLDRVYRSLDFTTVTSPPWKQLGEQLVSELDVLEQTKAAFRDTDQVRAVIDLAMHRVLPQYLVFHRDLLFHQDESTLFNSFFLGRVFEAILQQGAPWQGHDDAVNEIIARINDYIGYRPVAVLESQKLEPYQHEWLRPIPLFVQGVGVAAGRYEEVVEEAIELLRNTDSELLQQGYFDLERLDELALDPRAYDFDHPVNKRPNHHFGQWDLHGIDGHGFYHRFVVQQVTMDALMSRLESDGEIPRVERLREAAAVLAGTMLMASGICGAGPDTHDSSVSLATLMPRIAAYRDEFYERLIDRVPAAHKQRLLAEAADRLQPFGGARQHLNAELTRYRAAQLEHVHLSHVFARMGHSQSAIRHANIIPVVSARMRCQIVCRLSEATHALRHGDLDRAEELVSQGMDLVHRAIACGAFIDPWNILGFDAHFSLFPALENSVQDQRAVELISLIENVFGLFSEIWREAAASDDAAISQRIDKQFHATANWWRQFAAHEVSNVEAEDPLETYRAARHVAEALNLWHKGGASSGDISFWAPHAEIFDSPRAYSLVIDALLDRNDLVASMALLIHWLSESGRVMLEQGGSSWYRLARHWLLIVINDEDLEEEEEAEGGWSLVRKFSDYLEANAGDLWAVPSFQGGGLSSQNSPSQHDEQEIEDAGVEEPEEALYGAAYEHVTYLDTTDDGIEGELFDPNATNEELVYVAHQLEGRLAFHDCLNDIWRIAALSQSARLHRQQSGEDVIIDDFCQTLRGWVRHVRQACLDMEKLLESIRQYRIPEPHGDYSSMLEYDRQRIIKETLLERVIATIIEIADTRRLLHAAITCLKGDTGELDLEVSVKDSGTASIFAAILRGNQQEVRELWPEWIATMSQSALLYVPLSKGGDPQVIVNSRIRQRSIMDLLSALPRLGLIVETCELMETARAMERQHPVGPGAVTEYDELFTVGYQAIVENLVTAAQSWEQEVEEGESSQGLLVEMLEQFTELLLVSWLAHSQTLRLSVLERVSDSNSWEQLLLFIKKYGRELFTQHFLAMGNIRGILLQGVGNWLDRLGIDNADSLSLAEDLEKEISREEAIHHLSLILESVVENYREYRDYNSTTTQSDRGDLIYSLLDFLRLRNRYDRVCWNLRPVALAHKILVQSGMEEAASVWREGLIERIAEEAELYKQRLGELQQTYSIQMQTVADRLGEGFVRPMMVDRIRALVSPSMEEAERGGPAPRFESLEQETDLLMQQPGGAGLDLPNWLGALEDEVFFQQDPSWRYEQEDRLSKIVPRITMSCEDVLEQLKELTDRSS
tara:strand:- start:10209 stop:14183 length:3975 start_codon:yes stop_codon:yes gene_type:complete